MKVIFLVISLLVNGWMSFDNFIVKQENFNAYVGRQLKRNAYMVEHLSDYMSRVKVTLSLLVNMHS